MVNERRREDLVVIIYYHNNKRIMDKMILAITVIPVSALNSGADIAIRTPIHSIKFTSKPPKKIGFSTLKDITTARQKRQRR